MSNILDYIKWRGDLTIQNDPFNEIDSLILSRFSYLPFDGIIEENEVVTIRELNERFQKQDKNNINILWDDDINLFPLMGNSKRFGEMKATKYSNKLNIEEELQFSAITILVPDDTIFISYRGTDNTIVGWKEDFNMGFKSHVGAQIDSVKYLEEIADKYPKNNIRIGGHSKGGNLAVYSAVFATEKTKNRIIKNQEYKDLSDVDCIIILGAGVWGDKPSPMLEDRLLEGINLYKNNVSSKIIMSGDHGREDYDEVNLMKNYAIEKGIPSEDIFMDHAGFSTYETMYRAKEIFKAKKVVIVTQNYHMYRALYDAKKLGLDAYGV